MRTLLVAAIATVGLWSPQAGQPINTMCPVKPKQKAKTTQQRDGRTIRVPPPPSWQRAAKRAGILGAVIFVFIYIVGSRSGGNHFLSALSLALIYTALFIPFQFVLDRFTYNRWQRRADAQAANRSAKKR